jgi:hypothetical protein
MMLSRTQEPQFSDAAIRRFLLGQLRGTNRLSFERALFCDSSLEQRTRLEEVALADDYATRRLRRKDFAAFSERFALGAARRSQIEVSTVLRECFAPSVDAAPAKTLLTFEHPVWKLAFATMILIMLFATIWVATKEPHIVTRFLPHRSRPSAATTPMPEVAHHSARPSESATHRDDSPPPPSHEAETNAIVLNSTTTIENAPTVTLATASDQSVRVQLGLSELTQSTYLAELMKNTGEVVYSEANITAAADTDRITFDIPIGHLTAGDYQVRLTRISDGKQAIYFLRVR